MKWKFKVQLDEVQKYGSGKSAGEMRVITARTLEGDVLRTPIDVLPKDVDGKVYPTQTVGTILEIDVVEIQPFGSTMRFRGFCSAVAK